MGAESVQYAAFHVKACMWIHSAAVAAFVFGVGDGALKYDLRTLRGDLFSGLYATIVVFPAALAFGLASGLGTPAGIYGSIAVGFFAAIFGGTRT